MILNITDNAKFQIQEMLKEESENNTRLRFGVKGGGCSGLSYSIGFDQDVNDELDLMEDANGIPVTVKKFDIPVIEGTTIDYKQNMMGGGFTIDNPNAIISCGCGTSFRAKEREGTPGDC